MTLAWHITLGAAASLTMLAASGLFGTHELLLGLALFPWGLGGISVSRRLARRIPAADRRRLLLALVAGSALVLLGKALSG